MSFNLSGNVQRFGAPSAFNKPEAKRVIPFNSRGVKFGNDAKDDNTPDLANEVKDLKEQVGGLSNQVTALLHRLALLENKSNLPKVAKTVAPATVSILMGDGVGSGFWVRCKDGKPRIVTNAHVVTRQYRDYDGYTIGVKRSVGVDLYTESDKDVPIQLDAKVAKIPGRPSDGRATDLALSTELDIAVLEPVTNDFKLPDHIVPLEFEDFEANKPKIGDLVFKVGNAKGLTGSLAMGIVSRVVRYIRKQPSIQTDTSINPGDSGGPLINMNGKVIGVNNSTLMDAEGIGFSIPAPSVRKALKAWGFTD